MTLNSSDFTKQKYHLNNEIAELSSKDEFKKRIKAINDTLEQPSLVGEEINYQKERLSKLKFQYLEQETKEKFLRYIVEKPDLVVNKEDVSQLEQNNVTVKAYLKTLKETTNARLTDIDRLTDEISNLKEIYDSEYNEITSLLQENEEIVDHLERISDSMTQEKEQIIKTLPDLPLDVFNENRDELIANANHKLIQSNEELLKLDDEVKTNLDNKNRKKQNLEEVKKLMESLQLILNEKNNKSHSHEQQYYAQWLSEIKFIFSRLLSD